MLENFVLSSLLIISNPDSNSLKKTDEKIENLFPSLELDRKYIQRSIVDGKVMEFLARGSNSYETLKSHILENVKECLPQMNLPDSLIKGIKENYEDCVKRIFKFNDIKDSSIVKYKEYIEKFLIDTSQNSSVFFYQIVDSRDKEKQSVKILMRLEYKPTKDIYPIVYRKYYTIGIPLNKN